MTFNPQITPVRARENASPNPSVAAPRIWALIPCAGSGSRAQTSLPKQYQNVAGQPMVLHTLAAFAGVAGIASTLLVVAPDDRFIDTLMTASTGGPVLKNATLIVANCGGQTRATSVFNGLNHLVRLGAGPQDWVLVHDAARCLIAPAQIQALIDACLSDDVGGLLAHPLPDTLKSEAQGRVASTLSRSGKWLAQTPQMFRIGPLLAALQAAAEAGLEVTDESSAMEATGLKPKLVRGSAQNFKVTFPEDFALAEAVLQSRQRGALSLPGYKTSNNSVPDYDYP
jgi:2-C-methyl-D-erythritol 4-phosphate cytidylyltransferase